LSAATAVTDATGLASVTLTAPATPGSATVTATAGLLIGNVVAITYIADPNAPGAISIVANPTTLFAGQGSSTITATVTPAGVGGVIADGTVVTFATTVGTITASATTTGGVATATLTSAVAGTASVTATVAGITTATPASVVINALPVQAVVKLAINGTLPAGTTIDGAQFILNYVTTKGLSIVDTPAAIAATNGALANLIINNVTVNGVVQSAFANINTSPIATQTGEFATLTFTITGATPPFPELADFTIDAANSSVATTPVLAVPLTISVLSVTLL
jgi:adhesin/invasin